MVVVGAGPAGLAVAGALTRYGIRPVLLESGAAVGWAWRRHHPTLRLHTTRRDSSLPGWPMPAGDDPYPGRDEVADYLERYADRFDADVRLRCPVRRVRRVVSGDGGWEAETPRGVFRARHLVMASGFNRIPVRPRFEGEDVFGGPVLHSSRWPEMEAWGDLRGKRVLVVGLGNSGADLVEYLAHRDARVGVSLRGPVHLVPLEMAGLNWRTWYRLAPNLAFLAGRRGGPVVQRLGPRAAAAFWSAVARRRFGDLEESGVRSAPVAGFWKILQDPARRPICRSSATRDTRVYNFATKKFAGTPGTTILSLGIPVASVTRSSSSSRCLRRPPRRSLHAPDLRREPLGRKSERKTTLESSRAPF